MPKCRCGRDEAYEQYSFGIYAGRMCNACAFEKYRDHCGLVKQGNQYVEADQGDVRELAEYETGGYDAIYGEG